MKMKKKMFTDDAARRMMDDGQGRTAIAHLEPSARISKKKKKKKKKKQI